MFLLRYTLSVTSPGYNRYRTQLRAYISICTSRKCVCLQIYVRHANACAHKYMYVTQMRAQSIMCTPAWKYQPFEWYRQIDKIYVGL